MNRNSGNVSKTKKLITGAGNNSKANRKSFQKLSESSSISSNRNSSAQSEEDIKVGGVYVRPQIGNNVSFEEQELVMKKLQAQVKELRHKLRILEESVDSKDYSLGTIAREKDRAVGEIRRLERSNKQLRQQLSDERTHYLEEKEKFCDEMTRYKKRLQDLKTMTEGKKTSTKWSPVLPISKESLITRQLRWQLNNEKGDCSDSKVPSGDVKVFKSQKSTSRVKINKSCPLGSITSTESQIRKAGSLESLHLYEGNDLSLQMAALRTENAKLRSIICERDEQNYELCLRFLRMKHYKNDIRSRFQDLENEYLQVISNLMEKIDEARQEFNFIIDQKFKRPLHSTNAMYLQLVQRNSRMAFENASLRLENQFLKKELNKYMNGAPDLERKVDQMSTNEDPKAKLNLDTEKTNSKLKRIKKNVNFKAIRTIYEKDLAFRNSDTDSNYMSKTSTTVPSNGSLVDLKSNESIIDCEKNRVLESQSISQPTFQVDTLPNEILNQIFKRIDTTSSCQSLDSNRPKDAAKVDDKAKELCQVHANSIQEIPRAQDNTNSKGEPRTFDVSTRNHDNDTKLVLIEHKSPAKVLQSSSPGDSKESVKTVCCVKQKIKTSGRSAEDDKNEYLGIPRPTSSQNIKSYRFAKNLHSQGPTFFDKDSGDGSSSLEFPVRKTWLVGRQRIGKEEKMSHSTEDRDSFEGRTSFNMRQLRDSCGLQENIEMSDLEPSLQQEIVKNKIQTSLNLVKPNQPVERASRETVVRIGIENFDGGESKRRHGQGSTTLIPTLRTISKSNDILMEATRNHLDDEDSLWKRETKIQTIFTKAQTKTCRIDKESSLFLGDFQATDPVNSGTTAFETILTESQAPSISSGRFNDTYIQSCYSRQFAGEQESELMSSRRQEGSKRFSHRLISTTPEQLRSLLMESHMGKCYRVAPVLVSNATTEVISNDPNTEIVLQLVIPAAKVEQTSQLFSNLGMSETLEKPTIERETSMSGLSPLCAQKSSIPLLDGTTSDILIPVSSLPTSTSTVNMVDSTSGQDRSNIMLRTLSAPGLLESNWLDPQTLCEMRDCSTNT